MSEKGELNLLKALDLNVLLLNRAIHFVAAFALTGGRKNLCRRTEEQCSVSKRPSLKMVKVPVLN
jgi:hypothetical protein